MLSVATLTNKAGGGAKSVAAYMKTTEYYREGGDRFFGPAQWVGPGAKALRLDGRSEPNTSEDKAFERLLMGFHPNGKKTPLVGGAGSDKRKMGWDFVFSADKSVSILLALADSPQREAIIAAHHRATEEALAFAMSHAVCRTGKQGKGPAVAAQGYVVRRVDHFDSREGDPNLHSHCVVLNSAQGPDGKWRTIEMQPALETMKASGAIYRARLAAELRLIGYDTRLHRERDHAQRETGQVWHHVYGIGSNVMNAFSKRRRAILKEMSKGLSAQEATLRTRQGKGDVHPTAIALRAREVMQQLKEQGATLIHREQDIRGRRSKSEDMEPRRGGLPLLQTLHRTESSFTRLDVIEALAKEGHLDAPKVADQLLKNQMLLGELIELTPDEKGRARYATAEQMRIEMGITHAAVKRRHETSHHLPEDVVNRAIREREAKHGITLNAEQREAVHFVCRQTGGTACIVGRAGTGKTATSGAYIDAFQSQGFRVIGVSTAKNAAQNLQEETGIESFSCAQLLTDLRYGKQTLTAKTVVVLDEAGMVGARTLAELQKRCDDVGAKLLMLGDPLQLQPVEAGSPFRKIIDATGAAELKHIRRQRNDRERQWANDFYSDKPAAELLKEWTAEGRLKPAKVKDEAIEALVSDFIGNPRDGSEKLILANTHKDVDAVTHALRERLKAQGVLTDEVVVEVSGKVEDQTLEMGIAVGDRLAFTQNDKKHKLNNGQRSTVLGIDLDNRARVVLTLLVDGEKEPRRLAVEDYPHLRHAWASTNHAAQGLGRESIYWLASPGPTLNRSMGLVAFTRTKLDFSAYLVDGHRPRIEEQLDEWRLKQSVDEMMNKDEPTPLSAAMTPPFEAVRQRFAPAVESFRAGVSQADGYIRDCWRKAEAILDQEKQRATQKAAELLAQVTQAKPDAEHEEHRTQQRIYGPTERAREDLKAARETMVEAKRELALTSAFKVSKRRELKGVIEESKAVKEAAKAVIYQQRTITEDREHPWMVEAKAAMDKARKLRHIFETLTHETSREVWIQDSYLQVAAPRIVSEVGEHPEELAKGRTLAERIRTAIDDYAERQRLVREADERKRAVKNEPTPPDVKQHPCYFEFTPPRPTWVEQDQRGGKGRGQGR